MAAKLGTSPLGKLLSMIGLVIGGIALVAVFMSDENVPTPNAPKPEGDLARVVDTSSNAASDTINEDMTRLAAQMEAVKRQNDELQKRLAANSERDSIVNGGEVDEVALSQMVDRLVAKRLGEGSTNMVVSKGVDEELKGYVTTNNEEDQPPKIEFGDDPSDVELDGYVIGDDVASPVGTDSIVWINPVGSRDKENGGLFGDIQESGGGLFGEDGEGEGETEEDKVKVIEYATLDKEAVLFDALLATDMVGVVPTDGNVQSPFPFKLELGKENFATSNIYMPHLAKMRMSGYAVGEWGKSCVQGIITSATFVFEDGVIATVSGDEGGKLAYVTDAYGDPCISGKKYSNLSEYASISGGLSALGAVGSAISAQQFTPTQSAGTTSQVFTGNTAKNAIGSGVSGGLDTVNQAIAARYANVRDLIVARANQVVVIHLLEQLNIDYDPNGRRVINEQFDEELEAYYEPTE
jgi:integrating conjugative element protein (TIGR03752 family)